jgi:hypothetical protein
MDPMPYQMSYPYRSTAPRTLGVLSIVFGSIVAVLSAVNVLFGRALGLGMQQHASQREVMERFSAEVHGWSVAVGLVMLAMSVALLLLGVQQRAYKRSAVRASVIWGIVALVVLVGQVFVQFAVMMPAMEHMLDSLPHTELPMGSIMKVSAVFGLVFYVPYPIVLIACFRKQSIVSVMDRD